jgi:hypothetical protein
LVSRNSSPKLPLHRGEDTGFGDTQSGLRCIGWWSKGDRESVDRAGRSDEEGTVQEIRPKAHFFPSGRPHRDRARSSPLLLREAGTILTSAVLFVGLPVGSPDSLVDSLSQKLDTMSTSQRSGPAGSGVLGRTVTSIASSMSTRGRLGEMTEFASQRRKMARYFDPCAATSTRLLYAQGNSVVVCRHDDLAIERRFSRHEEEVQLLAVDNASEHGSGRLVVSYDAGQTAIVWDLMTGDEVARFASYEHLTVAAWMRNGNVAFGNTQGNVLLFEPTTQEHVSARTIDQIAITGLAPGADCRTFAIG